MTRPSDEQRAWASCTDRLRDVLADACCTSSPVVEYRARVALHARGLVDEAGRVTARGRAAVAYGRAVLVDEDDEL